MRIRRDESCDAREGGDRGEGVQRDGLGRRDGEVGDCRWGEEDYLEQREGGASALVWMATRRRLMSGVG